MTEIDTDQQDHDFFDILYQQWSMTTGAEKTYWMPEEYAELYDGTKIVSYNPDTEHKETVATALTEADADFICGLHGAVPDLIRRLHELVDLAARKDEANDLAQGQLAEALLENIGLAAEIHELERESSAWADLP